MGHRRTLCLVAIASAIAGVCAAQSPPAADSHVDGWLRQLQDEDDAVSSTAAFAFDSSGEDSRTTASKLIGCLNHDSPFVRIHLVIALGELGEPVDLVVAALIDAMRDKDPRVRKFALAAIIRIGSPSTPYLAVALAESAVIGEWIRDERRTTLRLADYAAFALSRVDGAILPSCLEVLKKQSERERINRQRPEVQTLEKRLAEVRRQLEDGEREIPLNIRHGLSEEYVQLTESLSEFLVADRYLQSVAIVVGARGASDIQDVVRLFASSDADIQRMALLAMKWMKRDGEPAVEAAAKVLYGENQDLQRVAMEALQGVGAAGAGAVAKSMLDHPNADIRKMAAKHVFFGTKTAAPDLIEAMLSQRESEVRVAAARSLSDAFFVPPSDRGGPEVRHAFEPSPLEQRAIGAFVKGLRDESAAVRTESARGLKALVRGPHLSLRPLIPILIERLKDSDGEIKSSVASVLGAMGKDAAPAIPALLSELQLPAAPPSPPFDDAIIDGNDSEADLIRAIGEIGVKSEQVETTLLAILSDYRRSSLHASAVEAFGKLRVENAIPAIMQFFSRSQKEYNGWGTATKALLKIGPVGVGALTSLLADQSQQLALRQRACQALAASPAADESIIQTLMRGAADPDAMIRLHAAHGLARHHAAAELAVPVFVQWLPYLGTSTGEMRKVIESMRSYPEPASAALVELLQRDFAPEARTQIIVALRDLQKKDPRVAPAAKFLEGLESEDARRCADGIEMLGQLGIENEHTVALAIGGLSHASPDVRRESAVAL